MRGRARDGRAGGERGPAAWPRSWLRFVEASPQLVDVAERQRAQLLAAILLALLALGLVSGLLQWLLIPGFGSKFAVMLAALAVLAAAYRASRSRHFRAGALLASLAPIAACVGITAADPSDRISGAFMVIGVLLASAFFAARSAALIALVAFVALALALLPWAAPFDPQRALPLLAFHAVVSPLLILAAVHRDRIELLRREELQQQQLALHEARQMEWLGRLAGGIAHDFNNLLTVVLGNVELLSRAPDPALRSAAEDVASAAQRGAGLTRQLLAAARKQLLEPRSVDLNALLGGLSGLLRRVLGRHIELLVELERELPATLADPSQLEQVVLNLAINARDAMPGGGTLRICTSSQPPGETGSDPGWVCLSVSDTGAGIDPEAQQHIFKPFFTTKGALGHGLGLATVRGIVEQSRGRIEVQSAPRQGSRFTVYLPRASRADARGRYDPVRRSGAGSRRLTVLLVEDEPLVRRAVEQLLSGLGHGVLSAASGEQAQLLFEHEGERVDVLLCDLMLPGVPGLELAQRLCARRPSLPVLFMSGHASPSAAAVSELPRSALLAKPFTGDELDDKLGLLLGPPPTSDVARALEG